MGNYNPHAPRILGQEWVPIREEDVLFSPSVNSFEAGYTFALPTARQITNARFYINELHVASDRGQTFMAAVYPNGIEDQSGPISRVLVPANACILTNASLSGAATAPDCLLTQSSASGISLDVSQPNTGIAISFGVQNFYPNLNGKRILGVDLLLGTAGSEDVVGPTRNPNTSRIVMSTTATIGVSVDPEALFGRVTDSTAIGRKPFGEINQFWTAASPNATADRFPWIYPQLLRLDTAAPQLYLRIESGTNRGTTINSSCYIFYAALEIIFCEEKRVAVGATQFGTTNALHSFGADSVLGANQIIMHDLSGNLTPVLSAGEYLLTLSSADVGGLNDSQAQTTSDYPDLNGLRELYQIPTHIGVQLNLPFPVADRIGDVFTTTQTGILPQLSLHASGGTLIEPHAYGRQSIGQVYGTITASQEIRDDVVGGAALFPWVRYYARRFGETTVPLTLDSLSIPGSSVAITPTEFDALDTVLDGWKEITLRFSTPPTMGTGTNPNWQWSAVGETSGNRWEVLGAQAPAISGTPVTLFTQVPSPNTLTLATYGQPVSGALINMAWVPQNGPYITGTVDDETSDATLIFAQDMPTVTGFVASALSQAITGIGQDCGIDPAFIPSSLAYVRLGWSATSSSVPVSGFGYYEVQRSDTITDWQVIARMTSPAATGFNDFEARVGILTSYRIRAVDVYDFPGPWSSTATITLTPPGVTGNSITSNDHVMIFTTNSNQSGRLNLAYCFAWDSSPTEEFAFPEAGFVQYQAMFERDFFVAIRPLERGGEQFGRQILVQAAAIPPETLADFTSLRDMAWQTAPYICVRDEDGNRWFASITVPTGRVQLNRTLYFAEFSVVEVTDTAAQVEI